jgi:predicted MPP superfamily phosphohydrolase
MQDMTPGAVTVLISHEPDLADKYSLDKRIALQLSGHSHGGQVRFPGIGAMILPYLAWKYDYGLYRVNDMWLYTNRGLGVTNEPVRFNCPPEVTEITLIRA